MRNELNVWVIGGDMRQAKLAELLSQDGHTVHTYALETTPEPGLPTAETSLAEVARADCVVLPLPAAGEGGWLNAPLSAEKLSLSAVLETLRPGQVVCAGKVSPSLAELAETRGLSLYDYFAREELAVANAVPTVLAEATR